jgi:L-rhamnose mutarotase
MKTNTFFCALFLSLNLFSQSTTSSNLYADATNEYQKNSPVFQLTNEINLPSNDNTVVAEMVLEEVEFMKVVPGMGDEYVKTEAVWKKIHEMRKANGEILYWSLFRCAYPSGSENKYDYITVTGYKNGVALQAKENATVEAWTKGLTKEEIDIVMNTNKTRKLIATELDAKLVNIGDNPSANYVLSRFMKIAPNNQVEYEKMIDMVKPVLAEAIKNGKAAGYEFFKTILPIAHNVPDYTGCFDFTNLNDALKNMGGFPDLEPEFKQILPNQNYAVWSKRLSEMRQIIGTELWKKVDGTQTNSIAKN